MTFYMYRAQGDGEYDLENINTANLPGVLYYLHHGVVDNDPRSHDITRIIRLKVTMKTTTQVFNDDPIRPRQFMGFMSMNDCQCPVDLCGPMWERLGHAPGAQRVSWANDGEYRYPYGIWYSLPGSCMSQTCSAHTPSCSVLEPGGQCERPSGARDCTWHLERAGEVRIDELEGIGGFDTFRLAGGREYVLELDSGIHMDFWDGRQDAARCWKRVQALRGLFRQKYPRAPIDYPDPVGL